MGVTSAHARDGDVSHATTDDAEEACGPSAQIDDPFVEGASIIDPADDGSAGMNVRHLDPRAEGQRPVGAAHAAGRNRSPLAVRERIDTSSRQTSGCRAMEKKRQTNRTDERITAARRTAH